MTRTIAAIGVAILATFWVRPVAAQSGFDVLTLRSPGSSIGLQINDLDGSASNAAPEGARVTTVQDGTPAARAGFQAGDIVVEFDGERVRSARQFKRIVEETRPSREVKAVVLRNGARQTLSVTPELASSAPAPPAPAPPANLPNLRLQPNGPRSGGTLPNLNGTPGQRFDSSPTPARLGVSVSELSDQLSQYFGVKQGVLVAAVTAGTPAERAGVKAGDVIVEVGNQPVASATDVTDAIGKARDGELDLHIVRDKKDVHLKATIPAATRPAVRSNRNGERL